MGSFFVAFFSFAILSETSFSSSVVVIGLFFIFLYCSSKNKIKIF